MVAASGSARYPACFACYYTAFRPLTTTPGIDFICRLPDRRICSGLCGRAWFAGYEPPVAVSVVVSFGYVQGHPVTSPAMPTSLPGTTTRPGEHETTDLESVLG